jgi:TetR/AcrR family transcriptional regulator, repressor for neighboring sulfatase
VTIRDVAAKAGVTHALVHRYFGTKDAIVAEVLRREILAAGSLPVTDKPEHMEPLELLRRTVLNGLTDARNTVLLITRAELAGLEPETMLAGTGFRPIGLMADWLKRQQEQAGDRDREAPDAALVSAVVGGAIFAMQVLAPWLMTTVGLQPQDAETRRDEIVDILMELVTRAAGTPAEQPAEPE